MRDARHHAARNAPGTVWAGGTRTPHCDDRHDLVDALGSTTEAGSLTATVVTIAGWPSVRFDIPGGVPNCDNRHDWRWQAGQWAGARPDGPAPIGEGALAVEAVGEDREAEGDVLVAHQHAPRQRELRRGEVPDGRDPGGHRTLGDLLGGAGRSRHDGQRAPARRDERLEEAHRPDPEAGGGRADLGLVG